MKNVILASLRLYKVSAHRIRSSIINHEYRLLNIILRRYRHQDRKIVLQQLTKTNLQHPALVRRLKKIVTKDFMTNAELALKVLNERVIGHRFQQHIDQANMIFTERMRRRNNKKIHFANNRPQLIVDTLVDKSKMKMLAKVKQQLKKPIRLH